MNSVARRVRNAWVRVRGMRLRNAALLAIAAGSASLEAPRLRNSAVAAAAARVVDAPVEGATAAAEMATASGESHLGFDTNVYPGDAAMNAWRKSGEYEWVGYYLPGACHSDASWSGKRERLTQAGWGLAVVYVGQQTWGKALATVAAKAPAKKTAPSRRARKSKSHTVRAMTRKTSTPVAKTAASCGAALVGAPQGVVDARDAIAKASREGFAPGTVIFLDVEHMDVVPQRMRDYYRTWTSTVLANGMYRPGIYAHTSNAKRIYDDLREVYDSAGVDADPPFWVAGSKDFDVDKSPADVGHTFADMWQGMLDVVRTHGGIKLPIDISVAYLRSPSTSVE